MKSNPRSLDDRLRDEASRDRPAFDEGLHRRLMASLPAADAPPPVIRRLVWPRYALAAGLVLATGVVAVVGSGWLREHVHQRAARREAFTVLSTWPDEALARTPLHALDSASLTLDEQWTRLDHDLREQVRRVRGHWMWQMIAVEPGQASEKIEPGDRAGGV